MDSTALRWLWIVSGFAALALAVIGVVLPVMPTVPFVVLAAYCFARGSKRWERWLLAHPVMGPMVRNWRESRSIPLRAKWLSTVTMTLSSALSWWYLPVSYGWVPAAVCTAVAAWLWWMPTTRSDLDPFNRPPQ